MRHKQRETGDSDPEVYGDVQQGEVTGKGTQCSAGPADEGSDGVGGEEKGERDEEEPKTMWIQDGGP